MLVAVKAVTVTSSCGYGARVWELTLDSKSETVVPILSFPLSGEI